MVFTTHTTHTHTHTHTHAPPTCTHTHHPHTHTQVVVIEKGCVVEQGTHDELISQGGVYKQLVLRQLMAGDTGNGLLNGSSDENHHKME